MRIGIGLFLATIMMASCQGGPGGVQQDASSPISDRVVGEYRLGSADRVRITVFGEPELSGEYVLGGTGTVSLPLIGEVSALGLTPREFEAVITDSYANGYLREPRVNAEVMNFRPFYILGEVRQPGEYPYTNGLTVLNAIATAGGFTYRANDSVVMIKGAEESVEYRVNLDPSTKIMPGDTIRIVERFF